MRGIRFYEEFTDKRRIQSSGNCLAVAPENVCPDGTLEAVGAVHYHVNSMPATTAVSRKFLRERCKRVSEQRARTIHPNLFTSLDA